MKLQCASCGLRLDSLHFKQEGLMNPKLTSICDICLTRNLDAEDYENLVIEKVVPEKNVLLIKGNVPGAKNSLIFVKSAAKAAK